MKKALTVAGITLAMSLPMTASAFQQITHKRIAIDAINYMKAHPDTTNYAPLEAAATAAGYTIEEFANAVGQGAYDVDDFKDTYICGAITGDCVSSPVFEAGASLAAYTSYWHFQNHTRGSDAHGNDLGGYNYDQLTVWGEIDTLAATWMVNDHLDDGDGGMTGQCFWIAGCSEYSSYNSYGITEANYRQGSYSNKGMYEDFQDIPFQPIDNLGNYWYSQFLISPTAQTLGFALHTTDLLQPHHTWTTSDLNHAEWESWVTDYYDSAALNADAKVTAALSSYTALDTSSDDIRPLLTQGGAISYSMGGAVLNTTDHGARLEVANIVVPHAIAMAVHLFNHAAARMAPAANSNLKASIQNTWGCSWSDYRCNKYLEFTGQNAIIHSTPVVWEFIPVNGSSDEYQIRSTWGCEVGEVRCGNWLTFTGDNSIIDSTDVVVWKLTPVSGKADTYLIQTKWGCDINESRCDNYLTFSGTNATIHPSDPVEWRLVQQ